MKKKLFFMLLSAFTLCVLTTSCTKDDDDEPSSNDGTEDTIVSPDDNDKLITEVDNTPENETDNTQLIDTDWELVGATGKCRYYGHEIDEDGVRDEWDETETIEDIEDLPFEWDELYFRAEKRAYWDYYPAAHNQTEQSMPYIYKNGTLTIIFTNEQYNPGDKNRYDEVYESGGKTLEMATGTWVVRDNVATWTCKYTYMDEDGGDVDNEVGPLVLTFERQTDNDDEEEDEI